MGYNAGIAVVGLQLMRTEFSWGEVGCRLVIVLVPG